MNTRIGFNAGELGPGAACRADLDTYHRGCSSVLNMQIMQMGGVRRRRGMEKVCAALDAESRLFSFIFNETEVFIMEFAPGTVRTLRNGVETWRAGGTPWNTPEKVRDIRIQQLNDVVYIVCKGVPPRVLKRYGNANWAIETMPVRKEPWLSLAMKDNRMHVVEMDPNNNAMRVICDSPVFEGGQGRRICIRRRVAAQSLRIYEDSGWFPVKGAWSLTTTGTWQGVYQFHKLVDGVQELYKEFSSTWDSPSNFTYSGDEEELIYMKVTRVATWDGQASVIHFSVNGFYYDYIGVVTGVLNNYEANVRYDQGILAVSPLIGACSTPYWSFSAFSGQTGYPSSIAFHQGRLWLAGTVAQPQTIWASAVDDFDNFELKTGQANSALQLTIASAGQNGIRWIEPLRGLCAGTSEGEWLLTGKDGVIDAATAAFNRQSNVGSNHCDALTIENGLVYVQRDGKRLRQYAYSLEADGFMSDDLTVLSEHILKPGVREMDCQRSPEPVLWCVLEDGTAATMTYNMGQQVKAWGRFQTAGEIRSLASLPCADGAGDEIWFSVVRDGKAWIEVSRDASPLLDHAERSGENWEGIEFVSEIVTNGIDAAETLGRRIGAAQISACFVNTPSDGLEASLDGETWTLCGIDGHLDGWRQMTVPGTWQPGRKIGLRATGRHPLEVLALQVSFNR